jgi:imidazolonepropionase-like amidohydrolase
VLGARSHDVTQLLFRNARLFDGVNGECPEGMQVLVEGDVIREVSGKPIAAPDARVLDVGGRTLMPGLIDGHIHVYASDVNIAKVDARGEAYRAAFAARMLGHALDCGSTIRREVFSPLEILRQATSATADLMMLGDKLGCVAPGAWADLVVVEGDPLQDIGLLAADGRNLRVILRAGELVKNELA